MLQLQVIVDLDIIEVNGPTVHGHRQCVGHQWGTIFNGIRIAPQTINITDTHRHATYPIYLEYSRRNIVHGLVQTRGKYFVTGTSYEVKSHKAVG